MGYMREGGEVYTQSKVVVPPPAVSYHRLKSHHMLCGKGVERDIFSFVKGKHRRHGCGGPQPRGGSLFRVRRMRATTR